MTIIDALNVQANGMENQLESLDPNSVGYEDQRSEFNNDLGYLKALIQGLSEELKVCLLGH